MFVLVVLMQVFSSKVYVIFLDIKTHMMILKFIIVVAMALILISDTAESSGGLRGNENGKTNHVVERIRKSRHKIVHSIEVKSRVRKSSIMSRNAS